MAVGRDYFVSKESFSSYHEIREQSDDSAGQPVEEQEEEIVPWTGLELIRFQPIRVLVQEVAVEHKVESCLRVDRVEEDCSEEAPDLKSRRV